MEIKGQLDATGGFLLQNLLFARHVSGTIMPIVRSSRVIQMVAACGTWYCEPKRQVPQAATICITLELLTMGIMVPETCRANNKFCNKKPSVASSWPFISTH